MTGRSTAAVTKANLATDQPPELSGGQVAQLALSVEQTAAGMGRTLSVEEILEWGTEIMRLGAFETAKRYIPLPLCRSLARAASTTDSQILTLIGATTRRPSRRTPTRTRWSTRFSGTHGHEVSRTSPSGCCPRHRGGPQGGHHPLPRLTQAQHMHNSIWSTWRTCSKTAPSSRVPSSKKLPQLFHRLQHRHPDLSPRWPPTSTAAVPSPGPPGPLRPGLPEKIRGQVLAEIAAVGGTLGGGALRHRGSNT